MSLNVIWKPQPKQELALQCPAFELFFGGAAGGGKSDFLFMDFVSVAKIWKKHARGILFRRTYPELEELELRGIELFVPHYAKYNSNKHKFTFVNGATLKLRSLERDEDVIKYQGHQYNWIAFDEAGNYPSDYPYRYMMSRCRSAAGADCYMRLTANPGGVGHAWLKQRFIDGFIPNRIYTISEGERDGVKLESTRCFIPSRIDDNKVLMSNDPMYVARLSALPEHMRRALLDGDWNVFAGQVFEEFRVERHVIKPFTLDGEWYKFASMDWGYSKPASIGFWAVNRQGRMIRYRELYYCHPTEMNTGMKKTAEEVAKESWNYAIFDGVTEMVADPAIWGPNQLNKDGRTIAEEFESVGWKMEKADNDRINGWAMLHTMLKSETEEGLPYLQVFDTCTAFIRTIPMMLPSKLNPEDIDTDLEDHCPDEVRYAIMSRFAKHPTNALMKKNGQWNFKSKARTSWNPLD